MDEHIIARFRHDYELVSASPESYMHLTYERAFFDMATDAILAATFEQKAQASVPAGGTIAGWHPGGSSRFEHIAFDEPPSWPVLALRSVMPSLSITHNYFAEQITLRWNVPQLSLT